MFHLLGAEAKRVRAQGRRQTLKDAKLCSEVTVISKRLGQHLPVRERVTEEAAPLCPYPSPPRRGLSQTDLISQFPRVPGSLERNTALLKRENQVALVTRKTGMSSAGAQRERQA